MRSTSLCQGFLASLFKLLNYLQTFMGVSISIYSIWLLTHSHDHHLSPSWFAYFSIGFGATLCLIAFTGYVAVAAASACCLCFYAVLNSIMIVLEAAFACDLVFNKHWEEDLPYDPSGELKRLHVFIKDNIDLCRWIAVSVVAIQALSLLGATILRAMIPTRKVNFDTDEDSHSTRTPLLSSERGPVLCSINDKSILRDTWRSRMRQKYGLHQDQPAQVPANPNASISTSHSFNV